MTARNPAADEATGIGSRLVWALPLAMILGVSLTRMLMATAGGGNFPIPGVPGSGTVLDLTAAPAGGWSWFEEPRALAHGAYTYVGYNDDGDLRVLVLSGGTAVRTITVHAALEDDDHDTPTFYVDPINDKLVIFYSAHLGPTVYMRTSVNTLTADGGLAGGFGSEVSLGPTFEGANDRFFTYPSPLNTGGDALWLFYRDHVGGEIGEWHYNASSDGGATWNLSPSVRLHGLTYSKIESDGTNIHVAITSGPGLGDDESKVWHIYRGADAWRSADGTPISGSLPYTSADLPIVFDGSGASDKVWVSDIALDGSGYPVIVFARYPGGDLTDHRAMYSRWNGSSWSTTEITVMGHPGSIGYSDTYHPGLSLDHNDPNIVYLGRWISGIPEMFKYTTADGGATFTSTQLTTGSSGKQIRPVGVRNQADIAAVWLSGTYTNYTDYSLGIRGFMP